jgi:DNA-directed RNA polymerase specialized sigma24 family protein
MTHEGYGQAYQQGFTRTVRLLRSRGVSVDSAEDLAQAAWLQGWRRLDQLRDEGMILNWVNTIAINYHRREIRVQGRYLPLLDVCGGAGLDSACLDTASILMLCRPRDRMLFEQQLDGLTTKEIAKKQGVTPTAIRIRILRARRAVRASAEDRASERRSSFRIRESAAVSAWRRSAKGAARTLRWVRNCFAPRSVLRVFIKNTLPDLDLEEHIVRVLMAPPKIFSLLDDFYPSKIATLPTLFPQIKHGKHDLPGYSTYGNRGHPDRNTFYRDPER